MAQAPLSKILVGCMIQITTFNVIVKHWLKTGQLLIHLFMRTNFTHWASLTTSMQNFFEFCLQVFRHKDQA